MGEGDEEILRRKRRSVRQCAATLWPEFQGYRRKDAEAREEIVARPILNLDRIQRNQVVITNYEAVRDYEFSFAYCQNGKSLWSIVVTDEAHEYKTPNSKISHAMKALQPDFRIACTGTPVENRLLDMWNLFDTVQPGLLGSAKDFSRTYERPGSDTYAGLKSRLLYQRPNAFLLRRSKDEVLELPQKHEHKLKCVMSEAEVAKHLSLVEGLSAARAAKGSWICCTGSQDSTSTLCCSTVTETMHRSMNSRPSRQSCAKCSQCCTGFASAEKRRLSLPGIRTCSVSLRAYSVPNSESRSAS